MNGLHKAQKRFCSRITLMHHACSGPLQLYDAQCRICCWCWRCACTAAASHCSSCCDNLIIADIPHMNIMLIMDTEIQSTENSSYLILWCKLSATALLPATWHSYSHCILQQYHSHIYWMFYPIVLDRWQLCRLDDAEISTWYLAILATQSCRNRFSRLYCTVTSDCMNKAWQT